MKNEYMWPYRRIFLCSFMNLNVSCSSRSRFVCSNSGSKVESVGDVPGAWWSKLVGGLLLIINPVNLKITSSIVETRGAWWLSRCSSFILSIWFSCVQDVALFSRIVWEHPWIISSSSWSSLVVSKVGWKYWFYKDDVKHADNIACVPELFDNCALVRRMLAWERTLILLHFPANGFVGLCRENIVCILECFEMPSIIGPYWELWPLVAQSFVRLKAEMYGFLSFGQRWTWRKRLFIILLRQFKEAFWLLVFGYFSL